MSTAAKRRVVLAALLVCAAWPAVHFGLSRTMGLDPWRFLGWSMYAAPRPVVEIFGGVYEGTELRLRRIPRPVAPDALAWAESRRIYGDFTAPDRVADDLASRWPDAERLGIQVRTFHVERGSGMVGYRDRVYAYERTGGGGTRPIAPPAP